MDIDDLFDMFIFKNERLKDKMKQAFVDKAVAINDISDRYITLEEMEEALEIGIKKGLDINFKPLEINQNQKEEINTLIEKYKSDEWNYRK